MLLSKVSDGTKQFPSPLVFKSVFQFCSDRAVELMTKKPNSNKVLALAVSPGNPILFPATLEMMGILVFWLSYCKPVSPQVECPWLALCALC